MRNAFALIIFLLSCVTGYAQDDARQRILLEPVPNELWMESSLYQIGRIAQVFGKEAAVQEAVNRRMIRDAGGGFNVELVHRDSDHRFTAVEVMGPDIRFDMIWRNRASLYVGVDALIPLAQRFSEIAVLEQVTVEPQNFQGSAAQNAAGYVAAGKDGSGIKIAVIDYGFDSLSEVIGAGELPSTIDTMSYTPSGWVQAGGEHGTGCLEAIYDNAPGASYYAYRIGGSNGTHFNAAIADCIAEGVNIISISLGPHNEGWADNSGPFCQGVITACNAGLLVFVSAGNEASKHWQGDFVEDDSGQNLHVWSGTDVGNRVTVDSLKTIAIWLQWNSDPRGNPYNLFLKNANSTTVASSTSSNSFEAISFTNPAPNDTLLWIVVQANVPDPPEFEIFSDPQWLQYTVAASSIESPGNVSHPNQITVGAVHWGNYGTPEGSDPITSYSSRGPTNNGALAPDIVAPTSTYSFAYRGGFGGTSCATPNAAGAAAALWSAHPDYSADGIRQLILRKAEIYKDWGTAGLDMTYGHGGLFLRAYGPNAEYIFQGSGNTTGTSTIPYSSIQQANQYAPLNSNTFFLGGAYSAPPVNTVLDRPMIFKSVVEDAVVE